MTSALVLLIASILHFGLRGSCFLSIERFPVVPGTSYAGHIAYCAILHFLYDIEVLPQRYKRRMNCLASFLIELVLGVAFMEVMALWLWCTVEHIAHKTLQFVLKRYVGMPTEYYQHWEWAIMGCVMSTMATLLWVSAYEATDPSEKARLGKTNVKTKVRSAKAKRVHQQKEEQKEMNNVEEVKEELMPKQEEQNESQEQEQATLEPEEEKLVEEQEQEYQMLQPHDLLAEMSC